MQRRKFLQNFLWLSGGLLAGCHKAVYASGNKAKKITGRVTAGGKGVGNVIVSDGFSVVQTARDGKYQMTLSPSSRHVFISVPSGYELPHEMNVARHYKVIDAASDGHYDFDLRPLSVPDSKHQFVIWADPQVKNEKDVAKLMSQSVPDVKKYVHAQVAGTLMHGICVGDIVWDNHDLYSSYNKAVEQCGIPFFQVIGNHDMDYRKGDDSTSDDTFKKMYGPTYYSFNRGQVHYVVLDDVWYLGTERTYKGFITDDQLNWLKKDLSFVGKDKLVVVCVHIPVHNSVENNQALYDILKPYQVHIMSGHTHYNNNVIKENVYEHVHGTVCGAWWTGPVCGDGTPPGYAVYEVNGTELSWYYKSVDHDKNHQIRAMIHPNDSGQKELFANVWNWDPSWKVEWMVDGINKGLLPQEHGFDPLAVALYKGDQLPKSRVFVEPKKTEHIFKAIVPQDARQIKVVATDRFKNKYEFSLPVQQEMAAI